MRLKLSITDTPGFGEQVDNSGCWNTVLQHVKNQFEDYLTDEISVNRPTYIPDGRIHCCLYFIAPTGHGCAWHPPPRVRVGWPSSNRPSFH